jgi:hypothetical protein
MKKIITLFAVLLLAQWVSKAEIKFNGDVYSQGWEARTNGATIKEFFTQQETTNTWKTMITLQAHPNATKVKDVSGPYFEARKSIVALEPKIHPKKENDLSDVVIELFLGKPGKTSHLEVALVRFIGTPAGVYVVVYSRRFPLSKSKNQDINVDAVMKDKDKLIKELFDLPVETIKQNF